jgi:hypothetical protein
MVLMVLENDVDPAIRQAPSQRSKSRGPSPLGLPPPPPLTFIHSKTCLEGGWKACSVALEGVEDCQRRDLRRLGGGWVHR